MSERAIIRHMLERRVGVDMRSGPLPEGAVFLAPDQRESKGVWEPTTRSLGSRRPALKSRGSCRGFIVDSKTKREIVFESNLEGGFADLLLADRRVAHVLEQPPAVHYRGDNGKPCSHTFDFLVTLADGTRVACAVKPQKRQEKSGIWRVVDMIREHVGKRFADVYKVIDERQVTPDMVHDARLILRARDCRCRDDVETVRAIASTLNGAVRVADLVSRSGLGARGLNSVVCLIDEGQLEVVGTSRIDPLAMVRMTREGNGHA